MLLQEIRELFLHRIFVEVATQDAAAQQHWIPRLMLMKYEVKLSPMKWNAINSANERYCWKIIRHKRYVNNYA